MVFASHAVVNFGGGFVGFHEVAGEEIDEDDSGVSVPCNKVKECLDRSNVSFRLKRGLGVVSGGNGGGHRRRDWDDGVNEVGLGEQLLACRLERVECSWFDVCLRESLSESCDKDVVLWIFE